MLDGSVRLYDGARWVTAHEGDFLHVPEGGLHGFRGGNGARMLLMLPPRAPRGLLRDPGCRRSRCADVARQRTAFMLQHDTYWV